MNRAQRREARRAGMQTPDGVVLGYVHPGEISEVFYDSTFRLVRYELVKTGRLLGQLGRRAGTMHVAAARNEVVEEFLTDMKSEWLWFVDTDMGFPEWALSRLLGAADKNERPIVGGLCFALQTVDWDPVSNAELYETFPTIGMWNRDDDGTILGYRYFTEYPEDTVCHVDSTGAACVLIHRTVFEKIGGDWFTPIAVPDNAPGHAGKRGYFGEDISFFIRVAEAGFPVWLDTAVKTSHHKGGIFLTHELYQQQQAMKRALERFDEQATADGLV